MKSQTANALLRMVVLALWGTMLIHGAGCATLSPVRFFGPSKDDQIQALLEKSRSLAGNGRYQKALHYMTAASRIAPENTAISAEQRALAEAIHNLSETHFRKGCAFLEAQKPDAARREFLTALRVNPRHPHALQFLKTKLPSDIRLHYTLKPGDTAARIAENVYQTPELAFIVEACLKTADKKGQKAAGILALPVIDVDPAAKSPDVQPPEDLQQPAALAPPTFEKELLTARQYLDAGRYRDIPPLMQRVTAIVPDHPEARFLINSAHYQEALKLANANKLIQAMTEFRKVDPTFKDTARQTASLKENIKKQADMFYRDGMRHFINEDLRKAVSAWQRTLELNPDHEKAREDIRNAERLLDRLEKIK